ncbi:MAG: hypothetical protein WC654_02370 [Patescibacteria group bacterium]
MNGEKIQQHEEALVKRREKKRIPKMRVSGRGMKRFGSPKRSKA